MRTRDLTSARERGTVRWFHRLVSSLSVATVIVIAGCHSGQVAEPSGPEALRLFEQSSPAPQLMAHRPGIEVRSWATLADYPRIASELESAGARPASLRGASTTVLNANGFRLFVIPRDALETVQRRLQPTPMVLGDGDGGPRDSTLTPTDSAGAPLDALQAQGRPAGGLIAGISRSWVDQGGRWMEGIRGRTLRRERAFELHDGVVWLGPGMLRLLVRCWISPEVVEGPPARRAMRMRIELVPQLQDPVQPGAFSSLLDGGVRPDPIDEGLVLHRLLGAVSLDAGEALVLVTDRQDARPEPTAAVPEPDVGVDTGRPPKPGEVARLETLPSQGVRRPQNPPLGAAAMPEVRDRDAGLTTTTVGQELLSARAGSGTGGIARLVVVFVPTIPGASTPGIPTEPAR